MRFCFCITNLSIGGAEKAILKAAELLFLDGHSVQLILLENQIDFKFDRNIKLKIISEKAKKDLFGKYLMAYKLNRAFYEIEKKEGKFNLIVSTLRFCDEVVKIARIPNVYFRIANTLSAEIESLMKLNKNKATRRLNRYKTNYNKQNIIAVSQGVKDDLLNNIKIKSNITVIYNPFNFSNIKKLAFKSALVNIETPYILYVGRFAAEKRYDVLLDAWQLLRLNMKLLLMTNPSKEIQKMINERGLKESVQIIGCKDNPYPYMHQSEMLILTSDREGFPNVLVEGLICGTRVISTDCPSGPREILTGDLEKFLVPMNNPQLLAKKIKHFIGLPKPKKINLQAFSNEAFLKKYIALAE